MNVDEALWRGLLGCLVCVAPGVLGLAALESLWLRPERGVLSTFSRARSQLAARSHLDADGVAGIAGLGVTLLAPALGAALLSTSTSMAALAAASLLVALPGPMLLTLGTANDERGRLALHDALAQLVRRALALTAVVVVVVGAGAGAPQQQAARLTLFLGVCVFAVVVLIRSRHRGAPTPLPRFDERLAGPALVCVRSAERAVVVVVAALAGAAVLDRCGLWVSAPTTALAVAAVGVALSRWLGPLRGEGVGGPLFLLLLASLGRGALALLA